jgi:hypothetical protein
VKRHQYMAMEPSSVSAIGRGYSADTLEKETVDMMIGVDKF